MCSLYSAFTGDLGGPLTVLGNDPLRALAAHSVQFMSVGVGSGEWQVKEAKMNKVNGVVQLASKDCRETIIEPLARIAFEKAGIPLLPLYTDNVDARLWDDAEISSQVANFIETRLLS